MNNILVKRKKFLLSKRALDTTLIILSLPVTLPAGVITAGLVWKNMGRPILFKQDRVGLNEETFTLLKFRSMLSEKNKVGVMRSPEDRLTKFGKWLRRTSLDELPQLMNVLKGDMSLVGPRPLLTKYLPYYLDSERSRHSVRPGITGAAQVDGRNHLGWDARLAADAHYAEKATLVDDLQILFKTVTKVGSSSGVAVPGEGADFLDEHRSYPCENGLKLRRFEYRDILTRVEWFNDPKILEYMRFGDKITVDGTEQWLRQARKDPLRGDYVLCSISSEAPLAFVGYRFYGNEKLPAVYVAVSPDRQGEGFGTASVNLLLQHMKDGLGLPGAIADLYRENDNSLKIWKRFNFVEVDAELPLDRIRMAVQWNSRKN